MLDSSVFSNLTLIVNFFLDTMEDLLATVSSTILAFVLAFFVLRLVVKVLKRFV